MIILEFLAVAFVVILVVAFGLAITRKDNTQKTEEPKK